MSNDVQQIVENLMKELESETESLAHADYLAVLEELSTDVQSCLDAAREESA